MIILHSQCFLLKALCNLTKGMDVFLVWGPINFYKVLVAVRINMW